ncbi:MAG: uroporphyrinogen-III C-methyltransferase [Rhodanobacter sp.]|jgi:uroporphyrin-3 C-methyltransferase|nr:uroporphyrinogen-III C-methyltransferase [Rhodanobacter sp.]
MSNVDTSNPSAAPEGARPESPRAEATPPRAASGAPQPRQPRPRGGGSLALALLLALLALGAAGYVGWRQWQQEQGSATDSQGLASLQQQVATLESTVTGISGERASLDQRLSDAAQINRSLREELLSQAERTRNLEDAVAKLAEKSLSAHDAMLLDETESLLRMASERYTLFHDARGAAAAYALADQTLAAVNDGAFSGLRQSIDAEHDALMRSQPARQAGALQQLTALRATLATLPLKPLDHPDTTQVQGVWSRITHALAGVISVQRDTGAPLAVADARLARELASLDLAQAQAALLAYDRPAYAAALQRVDTALSTQFDGDDPAVQQARAMLPPLAAALSSGPPVPLGAALNELRNLRAVHALTPDSGPAAPSTTRGPAKTGGVRR